MHICMYVCLYVCRRRKYLRDGQADALAELRQLAGIVLVLPEQQLALWVRLAQIRVENT